MAADEAQLRQALINLVRNAREAMSMSQRVASRCGKQLAIGVREQPAGHIAVRISDSGAGIGDADISKIFDPFFSTKERGDRAGPGAGASDCRRPRRADRGGEPAGQRRDVHADVPGRDEPPPPGRAAPVARGRGLGAVAEPVVEGGELQVEQGGLLRAEDQGALERGGAGGGLARGGQGAA